MRRRVLIKLPVLLIVGFIGLLSAPRVDAEPLTVVELFTSQACPVCRPAEVVIEKLARRDNVLALAFHVDYWDFTGWSDPYADPAHTVRQRKYMKRFGSPYLATPQFVINGRRQTTDPGASANRALLELQGRDRSIDLPLEVQRLRDGMLRIQIGEHRSAPKSDVYLLHVDRRRTTAIVSGDNAGQVLVNNNIVRGFSPIAVYTGRPLDIIVRVPGEDGRPDFSAVLVQEIGQGPIHAAAVVNWN